MHISINAGLNAADRFGSSRSYQSGAPPGYAVDHSAIATMDQPVSLDAEMGRCALDAALIAAPKFAIIASIENSSLVVRSAFIPKRLAVSGFAVSWRIFLTRSEVEPFA